ncbi:hypothetical protein [Pseudomonas nitroreducens]|uniref:hypothetical protein n=1 Tax=Pseudomonas nitroreducens TaxID=46680 RepID=UPI00265A5699|nr:hypothetical protein [Pseudomonas nitroreducens]MCP1651556.1 hypothetical protein [Pseudomonas nitroreducens]MCP1684578.1 hypothetical protein [Pseudomonas nitroreducens]
MVRIVTDAKVNDKLTKHALGTINKKAVLNVKPNVRSGIADMAWLAIYKSTNVTFASSVKNNWAPFSFKLDPSSTAGHKQEGYVVFGSYRLDFQGYESDKKHGNWQIQTGKDSIAKVLMITNHEITTDQFAEALRISLEEQKTVTIAEGVESDEEDE